MALPQDNAAAQLCRACCKLLFGHALLIPSHCTYARWTGMDMPWHSPKFRAWQMFKLSSACWTIFRRCGSNSKSFSLYPLHLDLLRHIYTLVWTTYCLNTWRYTAFMVFFYSKLNLQIRNYGCCCSIDLSLRFSPGVWSINPLQRPISFWLWISQECSWGVGCFSYCCSSWGNGTQGFRAKVHPWSRLSLTQSQQEVFGSLRRV